MQYSSVPKLYERRLYVDDPMVEVYMKTEGPVKMKKEKSLFGALKNPGSLKYYFKFHSKGRLLVGYDDVPPKEDSRPKAVISVHEVREVLENADSKKGHLRLMVGEEALTLKFDTPADQTTWAKAINYLREYYKTEKTGKSRGFKEEVDMETCLDVMAENERQRWPATKDRYDYTLFFKDKGLLDLFAVCTINQLSNRVLAGALSKKTRKMKEDQVLASGVSVSKGVAQSRPPGDESLTPETRKNKTFMEKIDDLGFKTYFGFLLSQCPLNQIDEDWWYKDHRAIAKPDCFRKYDFNTLYLFSWAGPGDTSAFKKAFPVRDMAAINLTAESGETVLSIMTDNKVIKMKCKTAWEAELWANGLRNAVETEKVLARTVNNTLRFNVSSLHGLFSLKKDSDLLRFLNSLTAALQPSLRPAQFAAEFRNVSKELGYLADGLYAYRPFVVAFFRYVVTAVHSQVRSSVSNYWNQFSDVFQAPDVLAFGTAFYSYERTLAAWGVVDYRFGWQTAVQQTYLSRVFEHCKGPITNIVLEFEKETVNEAGKLHTSVCQTLESHVLFLLDGHREMPLNSFAERLCLLANKVLEAVYIQIVHQLMFREYPAKIYIGTLNNRFFKTIKGLEKRLHGDTKSQLSLKTIKELLGEEHLLDLISKVEAVALKKLKGLWRREILGRFGTDQTFFDYDLEEKLSLVIASYENDLKLVVLKLHIDELLFELFDSLLTVYYGKFANVCESLTTLSAKKVGEILAADYKALQRFFEIHSFARSPQILQKFRQLKTFFESDDLDECVAALLNMAVFMEGLLNVGSVSRLLRCKVYFPEESLEWARTFFENAIRTDERQGKAKRKAAYSVFLNRYFHRVVGKFSALTRTHAPGRGCPSPAPQDRRRPRLQDQARRAADRLRAPLREQGLGESPALRSQNRRFGSRKSRQTRVRSQDWKRRRRPRSKSCTSSSNPRDSSFARTRPGRARWR